MSRIVKSIVCRGPIVVVLAALVAAGSTASAAIYTWTGGGADANWNTSGNWSAAPTFSSANSLWFAGSTRTSSTNNVTSGTIGGITFDAAASAFTLSGNAITLAGDISGTSSAATTHTINFDLVLNANRSVRAGNANTTIVLNGVISGAYQLTKTANNGGTLVLSNTSNSFSGKLVLGGGTTSIASIDNSGVNSAIGSGSQIDFGFGTTQAGILNFTGGSGGSTNRAIAMVATQNSTQTILNNGANGGSGLVFSGSVTHAATAGFTTTLTLSGTNTDANAIQSVLADGASGGTLAVAKSGAGTWTLSGANTYTGTTSITQGTLSAPSFGTAGSASPLGAASTVAINGGTSAITLNWTGTTNESTNKTFAIANTTGGMTFGNFGSGTLTLLNDLTFSGSGNKTLTLRSAAAAGTGSIVVAGSISDGANGTVVSVSRTGGAGGRLWLSGTGSTFSGGVSIGANGQLYVPFVGSAGSASPLGTSGTVTLGSGQFQGNLTSTNAADETTNKVFLLNGTGTTSYFGSIVTGSTGRLTVTSALATAGSNPRVLQLSTEAAAGGVNFDGLIANGTSTLSVGVRVYGVGGSFRLGNDSNSFTDGVTFLATSGTTTLSVATIGNTGANSAIGTSGSITFGNTGGTSLLTYTGAGETSDKTLVVAGAGTAGITANNASGLLKFTNNMVVTATTARGFVLSGSGAGEFAGAVVNGASASVTSLTKTGAGSWTLSGSNTYTGQTTISAGTLKAGHANALGTGGVTLAGGATLDLDSRAVGNSITNNGGSVSNAANYAGSQTLNGASTFGALGGTLIVASGGTATFGGALAATTTINAGGRGILNDAGSITAGGLANNGTFTIDRTGSSSLATAFSGTGTLVKAGTGVVTLAGSSSFSGATQVNQGDLRVNGSLAGGVAVAAGAFLGGSGSVGAITGAGLVGPGNSPGILTAPSVNPTGGLGFAFEFSAAAPDYATPGASLNDVLSLTGGTPFTSALTSANTVNIYFTQAAVELGTLTGGFFTSNQTDFLSNIFGAKFNYYVQAAGGSFTYNGQAYKTLADYDAAKTVTLSTVAQNGGQVMQMVVVPEPGALAIAGVGVILTGWQLARRRR